MYKVWQSDRSPLTALEIDTTDIESAAMEYMRTRGQAGDGEQDGDTLALLITEAGEEEVFSVVVTTEVSVCYKVSGLTKLMGEQDLLRKLDSWDFDDDAQRNRVVCALIGHSRICKGAILFATHCARCGEKLGDMFFAITEWHGDRVFLDHVDCEVCRENRKQLTWKDKLFCQEE
ncbi:MAG: hypothetical protein KC441_00895 [Anaerolineales bacterium]|nr:hypothetical protein [Anaerolineales bacterium]